MWLPASAAVSSNCPRIDSTNTRRITASASTCATTAATSATVTYPVARPPTDRSRTRDTVIGRFPPHAPERAIRRTVPPEPARLADDLAPPGRGDYPAWAKPYTCHSPRSARGRRRGGRTPFCASPLPHLQVTC